MREPCPAGGQVEPLGRDDEGGHPLAQAVVGLGHRRGLQHRGMGLEVLLHFRRGDVLAAADDAITKPAGDRHPAVGDGGQVAGAEPAIYEGAGGVLGVEITPGQLGSGDPKLARAVDAEPGLPEGAAVGEDHPVGRVVETGGGDGWRLGGAVGALHHHAQGGRGPAAESGRHPGAPARDHPQRRGAGRLEAGAVHEGGEQGRRPHHVGDRLLLDQLQGLLGIPAGHQDRLHAGRTRNQHAVQQSRHMGQRRRHQGTILGGQAVGLRQLSHLVAQASVGVDHAPGRSGGTGREHHHRIGIVGGLRRWHSARVCWSARLVCWSAGLGGQFVDGGRTHGAGRREVAARDGDDGSSLDQRPVQLVRAGRGMQGHRHRPDAPARSVDDHAVDACRQPERHPVALLDAPGRQPGRQCSDPTLQFSTGEPAGARDHHVGAGRRPREQRVQSHRQRLAPNSGTRSKYTRIVIIYEGKVVQISLKCRTRHASGPPSRAGVRSGAVFGPVREDMGRPALSRLGRSVRRR